jgi:hypothetical protein
MNSPLWPHMVAGLGTGLFLFDENGCPVNPLDDNPDRFDCGGDAPSQNFDPLNVRYQLDRIVNPDGSTASGSNHAFLIPGAGAALRDGAQNPNLAGPLGASLIEALADPTNGIVLDSWIDADGVTDGDAPLYIPN